MAEYVWRGLEVDGLERLRISGGGARGEVTVESVIDSARGRYSYELTADENWTFRELRLEAANDSRVLLIEHDGNGGWTVDGEVRSDLLDARDLDLAITPFTNTLAIRRLDLAVDDEADITATYVSFPDLEVTADPQRYIRLDEDVYRYESLDSDFERDIVVDASGVVLEYPGLFERL